jgi:hypothetical protein
MKTPLLLTIALFTAVPLYADQLLQMPDGGTCWQNNTGFVYGCSGGGTALSLEAARAARETAKARQMEAANVAVQQELLRKCLRMADQPKFPGREECYQMYGQ